MKNLSSFSIRALAAVGLTLFAATTIAQTTLYKYVGPDGKVTYSDKPPPKGTQYETLKTDTRPTGVDLRSSGSAIGNAEEAHQKRVLQGQERQTHIDTAQRNYDAAVAALEAAKEPQEGERTQNANGTSRLNENYFNRIAELQRKVDDAKSALDNANSE
jgi:hypothetical protein